MTTQTPSLENVLQFTSGCIMVSVLAGISFLIWGHVPSVPGPVGAVGILAALFGSGVPLRFTIRTREPGLLVATLYSLLPLAFWCWAAYEVVCG